jgi:SAM-dependent methyltransferase
VPAGAGKRFLDLGCNWGRWCLAAAKKGYRPVGLDPSLGAVLAARRVARQLGLDNKYVVGDARFLPFRPAAFDTVFSYSVVQHMSPRDAEQVVGEIGRVLADGGTSLVQMPTAWGIRCLYHQARRGFRQPQGFDVRYWRVGQLRRLFSQYVGPATISVDCFFGIGLQRSDWRLMPLTHKVAISLSEVLRGLGKVIYPLVYVADSVYVACTRKRANTVR